MLGYQPGELEGRAFTEIVHPDDAPTVLSHLVRLDSAAGFVLELRMRHASGDYRTIDWNAADLLDDPSVRGYVLNGGDVTEARQAAEDLVAARDAALVASRTKSEFVSTMSHEIRTPMNGVIGLTELLLQTTLNDEQAELASGVKVSAETLLVIINDILDFSKIEAGKMDIDESEFDVPVVIDDVGRILAGTAHGKGIELLVDVHPDVPSALLGDATRIRQILLNFGANAVNVCFAPLKLTWRGSRPFSLAATAITVRSRLYASRWAQISLRTISCVLHRRTSICIVALIERMSTSPSHLRS